MTLTHPWTILAELFRFGAVGLLATAVHVGVALIAHEVFRISPQVANFCGYGLAVWVSLVGHARYTFAVEQLRMSQALRFLTVSLVALAVSSALTAAGTALGVNFWISMAGVAVLVPGATFVASKLWAFSNSETA